MHNKYSFIIALLFRSDYHQFALLFPSKCCEIQDGSELMAELITS